MPCNPSTYTARGSITYVRFFFKSTSGGCLYDITGMRGNGVRCEWACHAVLKGGVCVPPISICQTKKMKHAAESATSSVRGGSLQPLGESLAGEWAAQIDPSATIVLSGPKKILPLPPHHRAPHRLPHRSHSPADPAHRPTRHRHHHDPHPRSPDVRRPMRCVIPTPHLCTC